MQMIHYLALCVPWAPVILVMKIILVIVLVSFLINHFY